MSTAHRSLARLPLEVFDDLITRPNDIPEDPAMLRTAICNKLKKFPTKSRRHNGTVVFDSVTTVGALLTRMSKPMLLRVLDPLLTYEECDELIRRVAHQCAPRPQTALSLLEETEDIDRIIMHKLNNNDPAKAAIDTTGDDLNRMRYLPTGLKSLDDCLQGGLRVGTITEVIGQAGAGKTQLAMQLCVMAARYRQGCVYIDTEKKLSLPRMQEIARKRATAYQKARGCTPLSAVDGNYPVGEVGAFSYGSPHLDRFTAASSMTNNQLSCVASHAASQHFFAFPYRRPNEVLDNVTIHSPMTTDELLAVFDEVEEEILTRNYAAAEVVPRNENTGTAIAGENGLHAANNACQFPVRLVIVDSIAAPTKRGFGTESAPQRSAAIFQCARRLKQMADQLKVAVLVINQVSIGRKKSDMDPRPGASSDKFLVKAALGTSWHHCVSTRILLEQQQPQQLQPQNAYDDNPHRMVQPHDQNRIVRTATILKSNQVGLQSTRFEVVSSGLKDVASE